MRVARSQPASAFLATQKGRKLHILEREIRLERSDRNHSWDLDGQLKTMARWTCEDYRATWTSQYDGLQSKHVLRGSSSIFCPFRIVKVLRNFVRNVECRLKVFDPTGFWVNFGQAFIR